MTLRTEFFIGYGCMITRIRIKQSPHSCHGFRVMGVRLSMPPPNSALITNISNIMSKGDLVEPGQIPPEGPNLIYRFASLTQLQYDRFKKLKDGNFTTVKPKKLHKIEDAKPSDQPR